MLVAVRKQSEKENESQRERDEGPRKGGGRGVFELTKDRPLATNRRDLVRSRDKKPYRMLYRWERR